MSEARLTVKDHERGFDVQIELNTGEGEKMYSDLSDSQKVVFAIGHLLNTVPGPDMILRLSDAVKENDVFKFTKVVVAKEEMLAQQAPEVKPKEEPEEGEKKEE